MKNKLLEAAISSEAFWAQAAAFGEGPVGQSRFGGEEECVSYLDAITYMAEKQAKADRRRGNRGHKAQATVGETMRRRIGGERYASA